jgi:YD repeat-containing protein
LNSNSTTFSYDWLNRLLSATYPPIQIQGGQMVNPVASFNYDDPNLTVTKTVLGNPDPNEVTKVVFDGLGREAHRYTYDSQGQILVDTKYDRVGRIYSVSNPYRPNSGSLTDGTTTFAYDALRRKIAQTQPDNSQLQWCYNGVSTGQASYVCLPNASSKANASWVDYSDEENRHTQRVSDALGRLTAVMEPVANIPTLETDYGYDGLDNLTSITQKGTSGETPHIRSFNYDSLSRLHCASNPENSSAQCPLSANMPLPSGVVSYSYDANGNVKTRTDSRNVTTTYYWDALNRLTSKAYSGTNAAATPSTCYQYDNTPSGKGRLGAEWTLFGDCTPTLPSAGYLTRRSILAYDPMGRIKQEQQCHLSSCTTSGTPFNQTINYDLAGNLTSYENGLGTLTITNFYDAAGRLFQVSSSLSDATHPQSLYSISDFAPFGAPHSSMLGGHLSITQKFDSRLRSKSLSAVKQ